MRYFGSRLRSLSSRTDQDDDVVDVTSLSALDVVEMKKNVCGHCGIVAIDRSSYLFLPVFERYFQPQAVAVLQARLFDIDIFNVGVFPGAETMTKRTALHLRDERIVGTYCLDGTYCPFLTVSTERNVLPFTPTR